MVATCTTGRSVQLLPSQSEVQAADSLGSWQVPEDAAPYVERYLREHRTARRTNAGGLTWCAAACVAALAILNARPDSPTPEPQATDRTAFVEEEETAVLPALPVTEPDHAFASTRPLVRCLAYLEHDDFNGAQAAIVDSGLSLADEDQLLRYVAISQQRYAQRVGCLADEVANLLELGRFHEAAGQVKLARLLRLCNDSFLQRLELAVFQVSTNDPSCFTTICDFNDYGLSAEQRVSLRLRLVRVVDSARVVSLSKGH